MSVATHPAAQPAVVAGQNREIPPLESGDRLTRTEFMRRYDAMPDVKAELIEGVVYVSSPVRHKKHGRPHSWVICWLINYGAGTPGVEGSDNSIILLDIDNTPQPDALLFVKPEYGGRVKINVDDYIEGVRTWSSRSPRAALVTICTTSSTRFVATECASTSFIAFSKGKSIGSYCRKGDTSRYPHRPMAFFTVRSSRASGSTRLP